MTAITYNGVTLRDVLIESISYDVVSDRTGVDPLYTSIRVVCRTLVHSTQGATLGLVAPSPMAAGFGQLLHSLMAPRRRFTMLVGNVAFLDVHPGAVAPGGPLASNSLNNMDVNNGPRPNVEVLGIVGEHSMRIRFTVELAVPNCLSADSGPGYLNLRYAVSDDIDCKTWLTTRTTAGSLRVANKRFNPQWFRNLVIPPLQRGFHRDRISLSESSDGLMLDFTIVDVEKWAQAPSPFTHWTGHHSVSTPIGTYGAIGESSIRLNVSAPKDTPKRDVIARAVEIADKKLHISDLAASGTNLLTYFEVIDSLPDNDIAVVARVRHTGDGKGDAAKALINLAGGELGLPVDLPNYNREVERAAVPTATLTGLFLSRLQTPCNPATMPQQTDPIESDEQSYPPESPTKVYTGVGNIAPWNSKYDADHNANAYTDYHVTSETNVDQGVMVMPYGRTSSTTVDTVVSIPFTRGTATREVRIHAERINKNPKLPSPVDFIDSNGIVHKLLTWHPMPNAPQLAADGVKALFSANFVARYALSRPPREGESVLSGKVPYHADQSTTWRTIESTFFVPPTQGLVR